MLDRDIQYYENDLRRTTETVTRTVFFFIRVNVQVARDTSESRRMLNNLLEERNRAYMRLASINSSFALANIINMEVINLTDFVRNVLKATEELQREWTLLDYTVVSESLSSIDSVANWRASNNLRKTLATGRRSWMFLCNYASEIKRGILPPSTLQVFDGIIRE
jgi:hypothetical protein